MTRLYGEKSWEIPNRLDTATAVAREALDWAGGFPISEQSKYTIRLAIEEMLSNTIKYGYDDTQEHLISIQIAAGSEFIQIELVDDARPFDPTLQAEPDIERSIEEGIEGGFGIALVRRICKTVGYRRDGDYNRLTLQIAVFDPDEEPTASPPP
jgi:serine/threonine-protein kinase RsbW